MTHDKLIAELRHRAAKAGGDEVCERAADRLAEHEALRIRANAAAAPIADQQQLLLDHQRLRADVEWLRAELSEATKTENRLRDSCAVGAETIRSLRAEVAELTRNNARILERERQFIVQRDSAVAEVKRLNSRLQIAVDELSALAARPIDSDVVRTMANRALFRIKERGT